MTDRLLTTDEVAELLSVPVSWVRQSTRSGAILHVRLGRYVRYREADVLEWLEACSRPGRPVALRHMRLRVAGVATDFDECLAGRRQGGCGCARACARECRGFVRFWSRLHRTLTEARAA